MPKKIFLAQKPAPLLESPFKDRDHFQLGTLSHTLNTKATGYMELSNWPEVAPDPSVRNVEVTELAKEWTPAGKTKKENPAKKFYSESEEEEDSSDSSSDSESESGSESGEQDEEGDSSEDSSESESESGSESEVENKRTAKRNSKAKGKGDSEDGEKENEKSESSDSSNAESSSIEESSSDSESESESESESRKVTKEKGKKTKQDRNPATKDVSLLDLDDYLCEKPG